MRQSMEASGFEILEGLLAPRVCDALTAAISSDARGRSRAGARHLMGDAAVSGLARGGPLLAIARRVLGASAVPYRATLFDKSARRNWLVVWHQDTALPLASRLESGEWGPWSVKEGVLYAHAPTWALSRIVALRVHLDSSTPDNGPLRVIPGSHRAGVLSDEEVFRMGRERTSVDCVLAMRPLLIHSSSKAQTPQPRRVLHIEYAASLDLAPGVRLAVA